MLQTISTKSALQNTPTCKGEMYKAMNTYIVENAQCHVKPNTKQNTVTLNTVLYDHLYWIDWYYHKKHLIHTLFSNFIKIATCNAILSHNKIKTKNISVRKNIKDVIKKSKQTKYSQQKWPKR